MKWCCNDSDVVELQSRNKFKEKREAQPFKFKLLSFLGLKEYLIDKYVFSLSEPSYEIQKENSKLKIKTKYEIAVPKQYEQETSLIEDENHSIYAVSLNLKDRSFYQGTVIYSHGNSSDLVHSLNFISKFAVNFPKFDYIVYDYTGYGRSAIKNITQQSICEDLQLLVNNITAQPKDIILWGFSLGTYPTVRVAAKLEFKGVILQSPLASIYSLFTDNLSPFSTFSNDCFSTLQYIGKIDTFLVIIHSKDDQIIPFNHSKVLFERHRMVSSNPFCFLVQTTALKHNHMHAFLGDMEKNNIRDAMHSYLNLMIESKNISKGQQLRLLKDQYLNDIVKYDKVQSIDVQGKQIRQDQDEKVKQARESLSFSAVKENVRFEIDDITEQVVLDQNYSLEINSQRHKFYFKTSKQAREQTEVSGIQQEQEIGLGLI